MRKTLTTAAIAAALAVIPGTTAMATTPPDDPNDIEEINNPVDPDDEEGFDDWGLLGLVGLLGLAGLAGAIEISSVQLNMKPAFFAGLGFVLGLIRDVEPRPSPYLVQMRLRLSGMRPINSVVDIASPLRT